MFMLSDLFNGKINGKQMHINVVKIGDNKVLTDYQEMRKVFSFLP